MTESAFDTLARGAQMSQGRRNALKAFGAAALATVVGAPLAAEAKKNNNKSRNKRKRRKNRDGGNEQVCPECPAEDCTQEAEEAAAARCQTQVEPCEDLIRTSCGDDAACVLRLLPCCEELAVCDITGFFACIQETNS